MAAISTFRTSLRYQGMTLSEIHVLDLSRLLPGAYCTQLLQGQGAEVTKIESPAGDPIRALPAGESYFEALHRGQQLVSLDLRTNHGRESLRARVVDADVLVEGFRPGVMERMELGYASLAAINPALVYCAITGYGSNGPLAHRAGHDLNYLARSGALALMPLADDRPVIPGLQVADLAGGLQAAFLITAALADRGRAGRGSRVEVSMTDVMRSWTALPRAAHRAGVAALPLSGQMPCYHVYLVADGYLTVAALEADFWAEFCDVIDRDDLVSRQFDPSAISEVQQVLAPVSRAEWTRRFGDRDVCVEPVRGLEEAEDA
jgi:alpha-methylacyl-CoA racemase